MGRKTPWRRIRSRTVPMTPMAARRTAASRSSSERGDGPPVYSAAMSDEHLESGEEPESGSEAELLRHRRENFERVAARNDPYPFSYPATATVQEIVARYERTSGEDLERDP